MDRKQEKQDSAQEKAEKKIMELMDILCEIGVAVEYLSRMCAALKQGFESPDFCDGKEAAACMWVMEQMLSRIGSEKISPEVFKWGS